MSKPKQYNWVCPECGSTKRAPKAPRKSDVRRYCLPCSEATGYLVERTAPVLEAKRERKAETKRARAARKAAHPSENTAHEFVSCAVFRLAEPRRRKADHHHEHQTE